MEFLKRDSSHGSFSLFFLLFSSATWFAFLRVLYKNSHFLKSSTVSPFLQETIDRTRVKTQRKINGDEQVCILELIIVVNCESARVRNCVFFNNWGITNCTLAREKMRDKKWKTCESITYSYTLSLSLE